MNRKVSRENAHDSGTSRVLKDKLKVRADKKEDLTREGEKAHGNTIYLFHNFARATNYWNRKG